MKRYQLLAAAAGALALSGAAMAQTPEINRTTPAGKAVLVRNHTQLTTGCAGSIPPIDISPAPAHGTVDIRPARFVLAKGSGYAAIKNCEGQEVDGAAVWYTPAAGFHGVDSFAWAVHHGKGRSIQVDNFTARITVQ